VDFVADKDGEREYFQVACRSLDRNTIDRELSVLEAIPDNFSQDHPVPRSDPGQAKRNPPPLLA
jgi:hypothetical protein